MDKKLENKNKIEYVLHSHPAVFIVFLSKILKKNIFAKHTKCLFLKDENNQFYLVCMDAFKRLDSKLIKKYFQVKKLIFASPNELKNELNATPGSVSLFAMIYSNNTKLILDKSLWDAVSVGFHPNINTATLEINHENLEKFINSLKINFEIIQL